MAVIGTVYKSSIVNGRTVDNIPYKKHDYPCWEGCCKNELSIGSGTSYKVSWLLYEYMPQHDITKFDFNEWTDELDRLCREHLYREKE